MAAVQRNRELEALIRLLDEPDPDIYIRIHDQIFLHGYSAYPVLHEALNHHLQPLMQERLRSIMHRLNLEHVRSELRNWKMLGGSNLLLGYLLITRYEYPSLDEEQVRNDLDAIRQDIWLELNPNLTALEIIRIMNRILFGVYKFEGDRSNYYNPSNSYINQVLANRKGNPLALAIIYQVLAGYLNLPVFGVNLPEHFILAYVSDHSVLPGPASQPDVLFYINPFSNGAVFFRQQIDDFLEQIHTEPRDIFYYPCSNTDIILRLIRNLTNAYEKTGNPSQAQELASLAGVLDESTGD